jgi:hypothetical protein
LTTHGRRLFGAFRVVTALTGAVGLVGLVSPPLSASGATAFEPGQAQAQAFGMVVDPRAGNLSIGIRFAESLADYIGGVGRGQAFGIDLGVIGTTLTTPNCQGKTQFQPNQLPQAVHVDSRDANASQGKTHTDAGTPLAGPLFAGASSASARATPQPFGWSHSTMSGLQLSPALVIGGGDSTAQSQVISANTRNASAEANISSISLGGVVGLKGLHWTADQRTGSQSASTGAFTLDGLTVGGVPLSTAPSALATSIAAADTALAPLGLRIDVPVVQQGGDSTAGHVTVPALSIGVFSSPLGNQYLAPALNGAHAIREALFAAILKAYCPLETEITVLDVSLGALTGGGSFAVALGGADARTDGTVYKDPFANVGSFTAPAPVETAPIVSGATAALPPLAPVAVPTPTPSPVNPSVALAPARAALPVVAKRQRHVGLWAGIIAVAAALGLALADVFWERRGSHLIQEEVPA